MADEEDRIPPQVNWEDVPRWYALSYRPPTKTAPPAILFLLRRGAREVIADGMQNVLSFESSAQEYGALLFERDITKGFGFDSVMHTEGEVNGYFTLAMPLERADGTVLYAESCSLLFRALNYARGMRKDSDAKRTQLLQVESSYSKEAHGFHGAPMGGKSAPALRKWMERRYPKRSHLRTVEEAMRDVYVHLNDFFRREGMSKRSLEGSFGAYIGQKGSFSLNTLGNACDVSTMDWWNVEDNRGHRLGCHNLDTTLQQVSLLAGFAALHDMAAKALDPR